MKGPYIASSCRWAYSWHVTHWQVCCGWERQLDCRSPDGLVFLLIIANRRRTAPAGALMLCQLAISGLHNFLDVGEE